MSIQAERDLKYVRMVILGDYSVGKTTTLWHITGRKSRKSEDTIFPLSVTTTLTRNDSDIMVRITDTGGKQSSLFQIKFESDAAMFNDLQYMKIYDF